VPWNVGKFVQGAVAHRWDGYTSNGLTLNCNTASGSAYICRAGVSRDQVDGVFFGASNNGLRESS
jgi:hypothetical protein